MTQFLCSVYDIKVNGSIRKAALVLRVLSSPGPDFASEVQDYLDYYKQKRTELDWTHPSILILYFGLAPRPAQENLLLPCGLTAQVLNINPDALPKEKTAFQPWSRFLGAARTLLLQGLTPDAVLARLDAEPETHEFLAQTVCDPSLALWEIRHLQNGLCDDHALPVDQDGPDGARHLPD